MLIICGIDEAGRGPIAGPVCAAAVVLPQDFPVEILNDSKKLSEKKREKAAVIIKEKAVAYSICFSSHKIIDSINILQATLHTMHRCYQQLCDRNILFDQVLFDGNQVCITSHPAKAVIKGDSLIYQIMAASILAKTARDEIMIKCSHLYPQWHFEKHKGYPTKEHLELCARFGLSPIHRTSFRVKTLY